MKQLLQEYADYNVWANEIIISFLIKLSSEQINKEQLSSFTSIRKTVEHTAGAEHIWLKRIKGISDQENKAASLENISSLSEFWIDQSNQFAEIIKQADGNRLMEIIVYKNLKGIPFETALYKIVMHVMNHNTYHRGQLVTMLRAVGFTDLSSTDLISFYRL